MLGKFSFANMTLNMGEEQKYINGIKCLKLRSFRYPTIAFLGPATTRDS